MDVSEAKRLRALVAEKRSYGADQTKICRRRTVGSQDIGRKKRLEANTTYVPNSRPASAIVEAAKKLGCNLIVMASHGRRGIKKVLLGSQTSEVVVTATVPVLVVYQPHPAGNAAALVNRAAGAHFQMRVAHNELRQ
jgi:nucleotide-binding universal stress UspA family protein